MSYIQNLTLDKLLNSDEDKKDIENLQQHPGWDKFVAIFKNSLASPGHISVHPAHRNEANMSTYAGRAEMCEQLKYQVQNILSLQTRPKESPEEDFQSPGTGNLSIKGNK